MLLVISARRQRIESRFLIFLCLCIFIFTGCQQQEAAQPPPPPSSPVKVASVTVERIQRSVTLVGTVEPWTRSLIAGEIEGLVDEFPVDEGDFVRKGELLARLRTVTIEIRMDEAIAVRGEGLARYKLAKRQFDRTRTLFGRGIASRQQFDDAFAEEQALKKRLIQLDAQIREYQDQLRMSRIVAPFDGWIIKEHAEVGQWIQKGGGVVEMVDLSHVKIEVPLPERYVKDVAVGDRVTAVFDALPELRATGRVYSVVAQANREARTFPIKVDIPNDGMRIKGGMVARITLPVGGNHDAVLVPKDALVLRGGEEYVFVVKDGTVEQVSVESGAHINGFVELIGTLDAGVEVVIRGNERLFAGQSVTVLR